MQKVQQLLFDFAIDPPVRFYIKRSEREQMEVWEYNNILGVAERGEYVVLSLEDSSSFIPKAWVVKVEQSS